MVYFLNYIIKKRKEVAFFSPVSGTAREDTREREMTPKTTEEDLPPMTTTNTTDDSRKGEEGKVCVAVGLKYPRTTL